MQLPGELSQAIEEELAGTSTEVIHDAAESLSRRYRFAGAPNSRPIRSSADRKAYIATRLPATYTVARRVAEECIAAIPGLEIESLLDVGSGPGTAMWAAAYAFPILKKVTLLEQDLAIIDLGRRLSVHSNSPAVRDAKWLNADISTLEGYPESDAVFLCYVAGELSGGNLKRVIERSWAAAEKVIAVIEPGTPKGFSDILTARRELIALGASIAAPCPHERDCPMSGSNWCHFASRVERTSLHRRVKHGSLSYEDEKYSYVVGARSPVERSPARVIRHPTKLKGHVHLELCGALGLRRETISRRNRERYRAARKAEWGSAWLFDDD